MTILRLSQIDLSYQGNPVLRNISSFLSSGARIGVVGPNGSGKTSLMRVILGSVEPEHGNVDWIKKPRLGYVPQAFSLDESKTPLDLIGHEQAEYLGQCGVSKALWASPAGNLSGGEKTRLSLSMALSNRPELLILDEPTNHLDILGIEWLERVLSAFRGAVITVSHDRSFLDSVSTEIWEVREGALTVFPGNYTDYLNAARSNRVHEQREYAKWTREVRELTVEIGNRRQWYEKAHKDAGKNDFLRRKAKKHAKQFLAKESALERLRDKKPHVTHNDRVVMPNIAHAKGRTSTIIRADQLGFAYSVAAADPFPMPERSRPILTDACFHVSPGQKVGLIGRNGCGKTTLLRLIAGSLSPSTGTLWVNPGASVGYLAQMLEGLDPKRSAADNVSLKTGLMVADARNLLGRLGITGETQTRSFEILSMGERTRVAIACLCFAPFDLLLLDEPTNHLDVTAREAVEASVKSFPGAVIVATHDRFLLDQICRTIWHIDEGRLAVHDGTYSDFRARALDTATSEEKDRDAAELVARAEIAYLVSLISLAKDPGEKADLERRYEAALSKLVSRHPHIY